MGRKRIGNSLTKREQAKVNTIERRRAKNEAELKEQTKPFTISLEIAGDIYTAKGETIEEGLEKLRPNPIKGRGIIKVQNGELKSEVGVFPIQIRRIMFSKILRKIISERLRRLLK